MTDRNKAFRKVLPTLRRHSAAIEAILPTEGAAALRRAVAYAEPGTGPKPQDDQEFLLTMAELELDGVTGACGPRELATLVVDRFSHRAGAGCDDRKHVVLPNGSCPGRKVLNRPPCEEVPQRAP